MNNKTAIAVLFGLLLIGAVGAYVVENWVFQSTGEVKIEAYLSTLDENNQPYTNPTSIDWGEVEPGSSSYVILTVRNISPITLKVYIENQGIETYPYLTCTWEGNNAILDPDGEVSGQLLLKVDASATQGETFSFDTILHADDQT